MTTVQVMLQRFCFQSFKTVDNTHNWQAKISLDLKFIIVTNYLKWGIQDLLCKECYKTLFASYDS